jgi:hypothetical protein
MHKFQFFALCKTYRIKRLLLFYNFQFSLYFSIKVLFILGSQYNIKSISLKLLLVLQNVLSRLYPQLSYNAGVSVPTIPWIFIFILFFLIYNN